MRKITLLALSIAMSVPLVMNAQTKPSTAGRGKAVFTPKTGDALMDHHLQEIDRYSLAEFAAYKKELASKFSSSVREIGKVPGKKIDATQKARPARKK